MTEDKKLPLEEEYNINSGFGYRHQQCFILFLSLTTSYSIRSCMGVALVAMTKLPTVQNDLNISYFLMFNSTNENGSVASSDVAFAHSFHADERTGILQYMLLAKPYPTFDWNKKIQDTILSSFFWGYMLLQIPGGMLAHRFGTKYLVFAAMMINGFIFIILPWAAFYGGWIGLVICRLIQGLSQAFIFPSFNTFFGKWSPMQERGRMAGTVNGGHALGSVVGLLLTGFIASSGLGWPGVFRIYGLLCGFCGVLLWFFLADTPAQHPTISAAERTYIENELGDGKAHHPVPWRKVLTCRGVWTMMAAHIGQTWGQLTLFSEVPAYMDKIMGVNIKANGLLTALPFLCMWLSNFLFSFIADWMIIKKICSTTTTRKIANSVGSITAGLGLIALCYIPKNIYFVESTLVIICSFKIAAQMGFGVTNIDIAPNFAGTIMSISNFVANFCGSFAPVAAGFILTDVTSEALWRRVFFLAAAFYLISNTIYVIFGTAETVEWNKPAAANRSKETEEEMKPMV